MIRILAFVICACLAQAAPAAANADYVETPSLEADVAAGQLPPVEERLPDEPRVVDLESMGREVGRHGGSIRMLMGRQKDIRLMTLFGYARFVGYDEALDLKPDILADLEEEEGRIFTLHLRKGHRWSDGHPFTSEDIRYAFEDVITNRDLSPVGAPRELLVDGEPPQFEVLDDHTVRFTWKSPNPDFQLALAAARPIFLAMPAHYLKTYHADYQDPDKLDQMVEEANVRNWVALHTRMSRQYRPENPDLPTLDPWRNTTAPPADQFIFRRNPYFHRVDSEGHQLPYAEEVVITTGSTQLIPAKTGAGESDLQARYLRFDNYTFLKEAEERMDIRVHLWKAGNGSAVALLPNQNVADPVWREIIRDVRFRRALSLAINRNDINQIVYFGLAQESADTVLPESPLYRDEYRDAWSDFDPERANALLDEMGLEVGADGYRRLPDGRSAEIVVETSGEGTLETDILELITEYWRAIGVKLHPRTSQREVLRRRAVAGETLMSVWSGLDNGLCTPAMNPSEMIPTSQAQLQWPQWGIYYETNGVKGAKPDTPEAQKLVQLLKDWRHATSQEERRETWHEVLSLYTDQVFSIGTVNATMQPVVRSKGLRNVPEEAIYAFEPGGYFGRYLMDTFWFADQ